jgi:hypothetical protein
VRVLSGRIEIALQATPIEKEARMSKETSVRDASGNPVYSMLENAMLVVDEEEAKKFLGATRLLQLMVDSGDGIGPAHLRHCYDSSHRYYFVSDLLYWNTNRR